MSTALSYDDVTCANNLATILLHAKTLRLTITAAPGAAATFLMCHYLLSRHYHAVDRQTGVPGPVACLFAKSGLVLVSEDDQFLALYHSL